LPGSFPSFPQVFSLTEGVCTILFRRKGRPFFFPQSCSGRLLRKWFRFPPFSTRNDSGSYRCFFLGYGKALPHFFFSPEQGALCFFSLFSALLGFFSFAPLEFTPQFYQCVRVFFFFFDFPNAPHPYTEVFFFFFWGIVFFFFPFPTIGNLWKATL